jgi:hypothetical protein
MKKEKKKIKSKGWLLPLLFFFFYLNLISFKKIIFIFLLKWIRVTILLVDVAPTWRLIESVKKFNGI